MFTSADNEQADWERQNPAHTWEAYVEAQATAVQRPLAKPLDLVHLLGPAPVEQATAAMDSAIDDVAAYLNGQAASGEPFDQDWASWSGLVTRVHQARRSFAQAAKTALRTPPRPGRGILDAAEATS